MIHNIRQGLAVFLFLSVSMLTGCSSQPDVGHQAVNRIWDTNLSVYTDKNSVMTRILAADYILLGEVHDNPQHHQIQHELFKTLLEAGKNPSLVMEMLDISDQPAIDQFLDNPEDVEAFAELTRFEKKGWDWPMYRPLVRSALDHHLTIRAANLSRTALSAVVKGDLDTLPEVVRSLLEEHRLGESKIDILHQDIIDSHCGKLPSSLVPGMARAQIARDIMMALQLTKATRPAVLIAGSGHVRRDRGVPFYLSEIAGDETVVSVGISEIETGVDVDTLDMNDGRYDFIWFTNTVERHDPCEGFAIRANTK